MHRYVWRNCRTISLFLNYSSAIKKNKEHRVYDLAHFYAFYYTYYVLIEIHCYKQIVLKVLYVDHLHRTANYV